VFLLFLLLLQRLPPTLFVRRHFSKTSVLSHVRPNVVSSSYLVVALAFLHQVFAPFCALSQKHLPPIPSITRFQLVKADITIYSGHRVSLNVSFPLIVPCWLDPPFSSLNGCFCPFDPAVASWCLVFSPSDTSGFLTPPVRPCSLPP